MTSVNVADRRFLEPEPSLASSIGLLALGLVPSLPLADIGIQLAVYNFTDPVARASISAPAVSLLVAVVIANLGPFLLAGFTLVRARKSDLLSWSRALRAAAPWAGLACCVSFMLTIWSTAGMVP